MTSPESIELFKKLGVKMTPELKIRVGDDAVRRVHAGDVRAEDDRRAPGRLASVLVTCSRSRSTRRTFCIGSTTSRPSAGRRCTSTTPTRWPTCRRSPTSGATSTQGIRIWAPPTFALLALDGSNRIVASQWARDAKAAGLDIITWTLERSGILADGNNGFYYQTIDQAITREGDLCKVIDVARQGRRRPRRLLGLGRAGDLLRQLHGLEVAADGSMKTALAASRGVRTALRTACALVTSFP